MMNDLFELRTSTPENSGNLRGSSGLLLGRPTGKGNSGRTGLPLPRSSRKSDGVPFPVQTGARVKSYGDLRASAERLMNEIEKGEVHSAQLSVIQEPLGDAFRAANATLEALWQARKSGTPVSKGKMLAAYDARVIAGHKWNPHRQRYQDALRWLKSLRMELKDVNAAIGS